MEEPGCFSPPLLPPEELVGWSGSPSCCWQEWERHKAILSSRASTGGRLRKSPAGEMLGKKREKEKKKKKRMLAIMNGLAQHLDVITDTEFPAVSRVQRRVANMPKLPIALVIFLPEKGLRGGGETPCTKTFNFLSK